MNVKLSIAMATYNGARYIEEQLQSFVDQTVKPDEIVITDDGSTDDTIGIIQTFAKKAPFDVRLVQNEDNLGYAQNFGKAISLCSGDIIFLSDQDDVWLPGKLERVRAEFAARPDIQVIINDARIVDGDLGDTGLTKFQQILALGLDGKSNNTGCCSAFRAKFNALVLPVPSPSYDHDNWLHAVGDILGMRFLLSEPLQLYRRHDANVSIGLRSSLKPSKRFDLFRAYSGGDSRAYTELALEKIYILRQRLLAARGAACQVPEDRISDALSSLETWEQAARKRLDLLSRPRIARIGPAAAMYLRGQYAEFSGWRSLAKDIVKP